MLSMIVRMLVSMAIMALKSDAAKAMASKMPDRMQEYLYELFPLIDALQQMVIEAKAKQIVDSGAK